MKKRTSRYRASSRLRVAPVVAVVVGGAVAGCQSQPHVMGVVVPTSLHTSTTRHGPVVHGVVAVTTSTTTPAAGSSGSPSSSGSP